MKKSVLLFLLAALLLFGVHLRPVYRVTVNGQRLEGLYEPELLRGAFDAAKAASEEISRGEPRLPEVSLFRTLRLKTGQGEEKALCDALLSGCEEVTIGAGVWINGVSLGVVSEGDLLLEQIYEEIIRQRPEKAAVGNLSGLLRISPVYTRSDKVTAEQVMLNRILSAAPVFYVDWHGKIVEA